MAEPSVRPVENGAAVAATIEWARLRRLRPSPRIRLLQQRFEDRYAELGRRVYSEEADVRARWAAVLAAYRRAVGQPSILRRA